MSDEENAITDDIPSETQEALAASSSEGGPRSPVGNNESGRIEDVPTATTRSSNNSNNGIISTNLMIMATSNVDTSIEGFAVISASPENNDITFISRSRTAPPLPSQRQSRLLNSCRQCCLVITYPFTVLVSIIGLFAVLIFCVFPTLLFMGMVIGCYYCMNPDPLPLSVLLRDLLVAENRNRRDSNPFPNGSGNGIIDPEKAKADRALYQTKLIVRRLLEVEMAPLSSPRTPPSASPRNGNRKKNIGSKLKVVDLRSNKPKTDYNSGVRSFDDRIPRINDEYHLREHKAPIEVWTDCNILRFSELLKSPTEHSENDQKGEKKEPRLESDARSLSESDAEAPVFLSDSQTSSEIELSRGQRLEASPAATTLEHDAAPCQRSTRCDSCNESSQLLSSAYNSDIESDNVIKPSREQDDTCSSITDANDKKCKCDNQQNSTDSNCRTDYFGNEDDARDPGMACDICIVEFEVGDEIAWSPNLKCSHAFHKDCILDW